MLINRVGKPEGQIKNKISVTIFYGYFFRKLLSYISQKKKKNTPGI